MKLMKTKNVARLNFNTFALVSILSVAAVVVGCVTVNVNFPESAVQKASDDYVRDLYRTKEQSKAPKVNPAAGETSGLFHFDGLIASAYADDEPALKLTSPETERIKTKMKNRVPEVIAQKKEGFLGEANNGMLSLRNSDKIKPLLKSKVEAVLTEENADRKALYSEIITSNKLTSSNLPQVKKSFTRSFQAESPSGTWVQSADGAWAQKP
jgi:uncharacterized protein YdbL (DUF1318 family)